MEMLSALAPMLNIVIRWLNYYAYWIESEILFFLQLFMALIVL